MVKDRYHTQKWKKQTNQDNLGMFTVSPFSINSQYMHRDYSFLTISASLCRKPGGVQFTQVCNYYLSAADAG
jgi:hypothetical protein